MGPYQSRLRRGLNMGPYRTPENLIGASPMVLQYLETMLWASTDESDDSGGEPLDRNYCLADVHRSAVTDAIADCASFLDKCKAAGIDDFDGNGLETVGHDLWLTRNGHGAGFWDGDYPTHGDALTDLAQGMGARNAYVGDDNRIYVERG